MAPQKKMTLQEFFSDQSFGGSWADDEIDMASISVPIEKYKHTQYSKDPFGSSHSSGGFGSNPSYNRMSGIHDNGPPYIVKLLNLPITCDDAFIEDLFKSRYTGFVKFKIVVDPSSNILETHVIKKVAFVELESFPEMNKVLKWQDLYYKATRRVIIEPADFHDFQHCISFNQEHDREIQQIQEDFVHKKHSLNFGHGGFENMGSRNIHINSPPRKHEPLSSHLTSAQLPRLSDKKPSLPPQGQTTSPAAIVPPKNKPNPFGLAKPVDVVSKLHEIDKKLITINHTTIKTMGAIEDDIPQNTDKHVSSEIYHVPRERRSSQKESRRSSVNILKRPSQPETKETETKEPERTQLTSAPIPESVYAPKNNSKSLAELLSKGDNPIPTKGRSTPKSIKGSPKPSTPKPIILKKKASAPATDLTLKESEFLTQDNDYSKENFKEKEIVDTLNNSNNDSPSREKQASNSETHLNGSGASTENIARNSQEVKKFSESKPVPVEKAERANDRPNFKKHFAELNKRQSIQKEKFQSSQNSRAIIHPQNYNNKKNVGLNHKRQAKTNSKDSVTNEMGNAVESTLGDTLGSKETRNHELSAANGEISNGAVNKGEKIFSESRFSGRNKNNHSSKSKPTTLPRQDKRNEEFRSRRLPVNLKGAPFNRNSKKIKDSHKPEIIVDLKGINEAEDLKDSKDVKDVKNANIEKGVPDTKAIDNTGISPTKPLHKAIDKEEKRTEKSQQEVANTDEPTSFSTGGKANDVEKVHPKASESANSEDISGKVNTESSFRGRGRGGRGRGRGSFRGSARGFRGNRGRGNFNLHYVRSKENESTES